MKKSQLLSLVALTSVIASVQGFATPLVYTTDFISDSTRTAFNGFEGAPDYYLVSPYTEGGITVQAVAQRIVMTHHRFPGSQGFRSWNSSSFQSGPIKITLVGNVDFQDVGLNCISMYYLATQLIYELYDNGSLILSGYSSLSRFEPNYIGFSGGGFDAIILRDNTADGSQLAIDNIETQSTPETGTTIALLGATLASLAMLRRRFARA